MSDERAGPPSSASFFDAIKINGEPRIGAAILIARVLQWRVALEG